MADREDLSEAYHVWAHLQGQNDQDMKDLEDLREQANQRLVELTKQLEEAEQHGDQASIERVQDGIEDAQQAWLTVTHALGLDDEMPDQPQEDEDGDDDGQGTAAASRGVPRGGLPQDREGATESPGAGGAVGEPADDDGE